MNKKCVVAIASDETYLPGALGTLLSIKIGLDIETISKVLFLHNGLASPSKSKIVETLNKIQGETIIDFIEVEDQFGKFPKFPGATQLTYARLMLPELTDESRVIYIDSDFVVLKDLQILMNLDISQWGFAAVVDRIFPQIQLETKANVPRGVNPNAPYFNAGLMLLNLDYIRKTKLFDKAIQILNDAPETCRFHDQSALNFSANGNFLPLPEEWNLQNHRTIIGPLETMPMLEKNSVNIHFLVPHRKPWNYYCTYPAETMYYIMMDSLCESWRSTMFLKSQKAWKKETCCCGIKSKAFFVRGFLKKIFKIDHKEDFASSKNLEIKENDLLGLKKIKPLTETLYKKWREKIQARIISEIKIM